MRFSTKRISLQHKIKQNHHVTSIIVDGYVYLDEAERARLGKHLWHTLDIKIPVIGVARNCFLGTPKEAELRRGESKNPLYITADGVSLTDAKAQIGSIHGANRIPILLKRVDTLCRNYVDLLADYYTTQPASTDRNLPAG